jgi:hypothetical protein
MNTECLLGVVIDVCTRSVLLVSDQGSEKVVTCDTIEEFMNVTNFITDNLTSDQIEYADLAVYENHND